MSVPDFEQLTLFREDFPASPSVWLESKKEKKMTVTYGLKCLELSENLRRVGSLVRTYLESSRLPAGEWCKTWSKQASTSSCLILKLRLSERRTEEPGLHLWPTPAARDYKGSNSEESIKKSLEAGKNGFLGQLPNAVKMWPTPCAWDAKGLDTHLRKDATETRSVLLSQKIAMHGENGGQLNPTWVEWLMGWPLGWTDLKHLATARFRSWLQQHSKSLNKD